MSYGNVTPLNDLPELEDLENRENQNFRRQTDRPVDDEKYQKYLRNPHKPQSEAGMSNYNTSFDMIPSNMSQQEFYAMKNAQLQHQNMNRMQNSPPPVERFVNSNVGNCIDIARHIQDCPICSKFYSSDKTIYIIVIVILAIVTLLLLKRVLNV